MRAGACDFMPKGKFTRLLPAIDRELRALAEHLREGFAALAPYKVPKHVELRTEPLPRTRSGKLLRREL